MKKLLLLITCAFFFNILTAQNNAIKITNLNTNKEKIIKENKKIRIKTFDGRKIKGRFKIENNNTISIDGLRINLKDIKALKRNPILTSILTTGFLIYSGLIIAGIGVITAIFADSTGYWLLVPAAATIYTGIKSPNFNKNHKIEKGWNFEIISISN